MIIANGTIEVKLKNAGGIDPVTGYPVASTGPVTQQASAGETRQTETTPPVWGTPIPCQWSAVTKDNLGRTVSGNFTLASYSVLIEQDGTPFTAEQVRLKDTGGNAVGEFSVISAEPLDAVCETRILIR